MSGTSNLNFFNILREFRAVGEFARFANRAWAWPFTPRAARPRHILLIPGFLAGDVTLYPFADWLRSRGHNVFFSGILANTDCPRSAIERLSGILQERSDRAGEKMVVIGHSLGGIYARELARRLPQYVDHVVLLGAPIRDPFKNSNPYVKMLAVLTRRIHESGRGCSGDLATICGVNHFDPPPGIPETIVYTKSDGVVDWMSCIEDGPDVAAFEVDSTHCGIPYNLDTMRIIGDRIERVSPLVSARN
jgi:hypothetical protein